MTQPATDPWGFEEEAAETWADILQPQAADLIWLGAFLILALISFRRKSAPLKYATLAIAVGYMGFAKSHLISITNIFSVLDWNLPVWKHNLAWYLFAVFTLVSTVLWGRLYCGRICAFGAMTQLMDRIVPARLRIDVPRRIEDRAAWVKYALLGGVLAYFFISGNVTAYVVRQE